VNEHALLFVDTGSDGTAAPLRAVGGSAPDTLCMRTAVVAGAAPAFVECTQLILADDDVLHLYGVSAQECFERVRPLVGDAVMGVVIVVDDTRPDALAALDDGLVRFAALVAEVPLIVGICRLRAAGASGLDEYARHLAGRGLDAAVVAIDPCAREDVLYLVNMMVALVDSAQADGARPGAA